MTAAAEAWPHHANPCMWATCPCPHPKAPIATRSLADDVVEDLRAQLREERARTDILLTTLPKCSKEVGIGIHCSEPATRAQGANLFPRYCELHVDRMRVLVELPQARIIREIKAARRAR